jgi:cytochrome c-type biogenesis protein CcmF
MAQLGRACLILALAVAIYGAAASLYGWRTGRREWTTSGRRAVYTLAGLTTIAFAVLEVAFIRSDFSFATVVGHSSTTTPLFYRIAAPWSSQEGSLLLWAWLLSVWSSLVLFFSRRRMREVAPVATAVLMGFGAFFVGLLVFKASPFDQLAVAPAEGAGLNPLLRYPSMMIHPPMLYSGYTLFTIPFAFAVGALVTRRVDSEWIMVTRRFSLAAWCCLGLGILLGARWSYAELGWGGYWAWDPVENASLMPWLTGTAFLHSVMIQEKRGMLKVWNVSLVLATGTLAILGTFLVRSGILDSIHAFGASTLGTPFVTLIAILVVGSVVLVVSRRDMLRTEHHLDSLLSREAAFLFNNLVLVGLCFVIFWGTFFPLISEAVTGNKSAVGPPWFNRYTVPLVLLLVLLSGIGPIISWRRATWANVKRNFRVPIAVAGLTAVLLVAVGGVARKPSAFLLFLVAGFAIGSVLQEFWRGARARRAMSDDGPVAAVISLVRRNRRRYGGYIIHLGMALLFIGVAASSAFQHARDVRMQVGQTAHVGGYDVTYRKPTGDIVVNGGRVERIFFGAKLDVAKGGKKVGTLNAERGYYPAATDGEFGILGRYFEGEATSEIGLKAGWRRDIWTAITPDTEPLRPIIDKGDKTFGAATGKIPAQMEAALLGQALRGLVNRYVQNPPPAMFRVMVSPLVTWIWAGGIVVFLGGLIALWPAPDVVGRRTRAGYLARVARALGRA